MESGFKKSAVIAQGSDDVFEPPTTHREVPLVTDLHDSSSAITESSTSFILRRPVSNEAKNQKARAHFRSSGYGTGSEDSIQEATSSKTSLQMSQESFTEEAFVEPQDSQTLMGSYKPHMENYFQLKNGESDSVVQNQARQESIKSSRGAEGRIASGTRIIGIDQHSHDYPQHLNIRSALVQEHSKAAPLHSDQQKTNDAYTTKTHETDNGMFLTEIRQQQPTMDKNGTAVIDSANNINLPMTNQPHPTISSGMNFSQSPLSSCIRCTCCVAQQVKTKPALTRQSVLQHQETMPDISECSGENHNDLRFASDNDDLTNREHISEESLDHIHPTKSQYIPELDTPSSCFSFYLSDQTSVSASMSSSIECKFDHVLLNVLERGARCTEMNCQDANCAQMRQDMAVLQDFRNDVFTLNEPHLLLLRAMCYHTFDLCTHPKCPFHWCGEQEDKPRSLKDRLQIMKQRLENFAEYCRLSSSPVIDYLKLNNSQLYDVMPLEGQDWVRLCTLGTSRKTVLAFPLKSNLCSDFKYWVIKKVPKTKYLNQWSLYCRLLKVSHMSIASLFWAANFEDYLLVCYPFENLSLRDCLSTVPSQHLQLISIYRIMQQLMSATDHLNGMGIAYLYWTSKNIMVKDQTAREFDVKICNFSCSAILDNYDGGQLSLILPPSLATPELREDDLVEPVSDVWGLGCLLHELVTGVPVWYQHRHIPDVNLKTLLGKTPVPDIPSTHPELLPVFKACWVIDWTKRTSVRELHAVMSQAYSGSLKT